MINRALFPGSFDPFTIGHYSLVNRALTVVDEVVIAVGVNETKGSLLSVDERVNYIRRIYADNECVRVVKYGDLTVDVARREGAGFILRGVRNGVDFEYERMIAEVNRTLENIETLLLFSEPALAHVSSSMVREIHRFGREIDDYLPFPL